ncbi:putative Rmd1/YagE family protein [Natronobacillus azotifigens]|uniref:Lipoprotein n=1 Tax=Natronobacillus azotifigens TaxID=472978 RepID=A0A9J6REL3_9BACI|nr:lipoprotein [Natronobacillus azotifigens]MCZ0703804.1 lipoprotein [Natronobacillus azotifigens]
MKKIQIFIFLLGIMFTLAGCGTSSSVNDEVEVTGFNDEGKNEFTDMERNQYDVPIVFEQEILSLIQQNLVAANNRNVDEYVRQLVADDQTEEMIELIHATFDMYEELHLTFTFDGGSVIYSKEDEAVVDITQQIRTAEFDEFNNYQSDTNALHFVVKEDEEWKIFASYTTKSIWLMENGEPDINGDVFSVVDDTDIWATRVEEMISQDQLPSEYLEDL